MVSRLLSVNTILSTASLELPSEVGLWLFLVSLAAFVRRFVVYSLSFWGFSNLLFFVSFCVSLFVALVFVCFCHCVLQSILGFALLAGHLCVFVDLVQISGPSEHFVLPSPGPFFGIFFFEENRSH